MSSPIYTTQNTNKAGTCPHGLPQGACPICNGIGGGAGKMKNSAPVSRPRNNEWSYMKCLTVGMAMRAQEKRELNAKLTLQRQLEIAQTLRNSVNNMVEKIKTTLAEIQKTMPTFIAKVLSFIANITILPILKIVAQIPKLIEKFVQFEKNFMNFLHSAGEKLTAILGDIKNFLNRKITEPIKKKAKKFFLFFVSNTQDENYKNDETLSVFKSRELKKYLIKILKRNNK